MSRALQRQRHVVAAQLKPLAQIGAVRSVAGVTSVQMNGGTLLGFGMRNQPIKHSACKPLASMRLQRGEVVDVQHLAPGKELGQAKARGTFDQAFVAQREYLVAAGLLPPHLFKKPLRYKVRAQGQKGREAGLNVCVCVGDEKVEGHADQIVSYQLKPSRDANVVSHQ